MSRAKNAEHAQPRRFKPYPAYKDSGVEWLGEIPEHWNVARISELTSLLNGYPFDSEFFTRGEGTPLVRIRDLNAEETEVNYVGPIVENAWIQSGDVIIGMDGDFNVARWRGQRALLNQRMCCLRPRGCTDSGFIAYLLPLPLQVINDLTYSTTVKHLSSGGVRKVRLGAPPEPEQRAIAAFLDRETARIDALVAKKERLIELLQEKRTALITRAVTKGLDPNVPMKDSGVEWLGEIPAHWEVKRIRDIADSLQTGPFGSQLHAGEYVSGGCPVINPADLQNGQLVPDWDCTVDDATARRLERHRLTAGDILFARRGELGRCGLATQQQQGWICGTGSLRLRTRPDVATPRFVLRLLSTSGVRDWLQLQSVGSTMQNLNTAIIGRIPMVLPMPAEQEAITAHLDRETTRLDALVAKVRDAIERLKELRTALISAAVTGKIDVRGDVL